MLEISFKKYLEEKIEQNPALALEVETTKNAVKIAHQIYGLRKKKGLTQSKLAKKIGISQSNIARIENADYNHYTRTTLDRVAKGLGADLNIFISLPEQTNKLIAAYNSFPTYQGFNFAGSLGKYFIAGIGTFDVIGEQAVNKQSLIENKEVSINTEVSLFKQERWFYQQGL